MRHEVPGGGDHYDWFVQNPRDPGGVLRSFRVASADGVCAAFGVKTSHGETVTGAAVAAGQASAAGAANGRGQVVFEAERTPDHRNVYLAYEGEISGGRGSVRRVAAWQVRVVEWTDETLVLVGSDATVEVCGRRVAGARWEFRRGATGDG